MNVTQAELVSQPSMWESTVALLPDVAARLPARGSRVAILGCGTSYYVAQAAASLREAAGHGRTDAFVASEVPRRRDDYDTIVAISRSGTTTEVVRALHEFDSPVPALAVSAVDGTPVVAAADDAILLEFADESSVVQTRFATSALALLRAHAGGDLQTAIADARAALAEPLDIDPTGFSQFVFLGRGWTVGLANEAALKLREASLSWTESYPAMEYRHGPISTASPQTLVWLLGVDDDALVADIAATGATVRTGEGDPMAELVAIQRMAVELAVARDLDPDRPRHLTRSIVLP